MDYETITERARQLLPSMRSWAAKAGHEPKGILNSEILFLLACLQGVKFDRILESGRARGQSTLLLSLALPDCPIISVEYDERSADVAVAQERLQDRKNVTLLFGDARAMLPAMVREGDVVLIDGPKGLSGIRLAIRLLATGKVSHVFVHDLTIDTPRRRFIDSHFPEALYSDRRGFAAVAAVADEGLESEIPVHRRLNGFSGEHGYGFALLCLPYVAGRAYSWLRLKVIGAGLIRRVAKWYGKRF